MLQLFERRSANAQTLQSGHERFVVDTCSDRPDLFDACVAMENEVWDDVAFLDHTRAHHAHYEELLERFPDYHLCMTEADSGELVATGMCVPLNLANDAALPREGWDWIVDTASAQRGRFASSRGAFDFGA